MNIYVLLGLGAFAVLLMLLLVVTLPYTLAGLRVFLGKLRYKQNTGLIFLRSKAGNIPMPIPCDLTSNQFKIKLNKTENTYPLHRSHFDTGGTFFGHPYIIYDIEDCKNTIGLHYETSDENGNPTGKITPIKSAVTLSPSIIKALIGEQALSQALKELFEKNQLLIYMLIGNIAVAGIGAYLAYDTYATLLPSIEDKLTTIIGMIG